MVHNSLEQPTRGISRLVGRTTFFNRIKSSFEEGTSYIAAMVRKGFHSRKAAGSGKSSSLVLILGLLTVLITIGILYSVTMAPYAGTGGPSRNSALAEQPKSLSQKILEWLPHGLASHQSADDIDIFPDWKQEFWSPTNVEISNDPMITLCRLNFKQYSETPHLYPMFRDLENMSKCRGSNKKRERLSVLMKEIHDNEGKPEGKIVPPTAFVFHESRVGSTLVANALASNPFAMVYSESPPVASALLHCKTCSMQRNIEIFRDVVTLMGRSPIHQHIFFKFQSITSTKMHIALQVSKHKVNLRFDYIFD